MKNRLEKIFEIKREELYDLYMQAPFCMGILGGPNHIFEMASPYYLQLIGKKDIIGKTVKEVLPELEAQDISVFLDTVYETGKPFLVNEMLMQLDLYGYRKPVDVYLNFIFKAHNSSDGVDSIFFFVNDVTEQVVLRKKIEEDERCHRELIHNLPVATYSCDAQGRILIYNKAALALWGREPEIGKDVWNFSCTVYNSKDNNPISPDSCPMALALKEGKAIVGEEMIIERSHRDKLNVVPHAVPFIDSSGQVTGAVNILLDITENKIAQQSFIENEKKYRYLFEKNQLPMWVIDSKTFKFLSVNKMAIHQYGYSRKEFLSMTAQDLMSDEDKEHFTQSSESFKIKGTNYNKGIWNHKKKNGTIIPVQSIAQDIVFEGVLAKFIIMEDVIKLKKAELNLKQQHKELTNYKYALDESSIVTITDQRGRIIYVNDNFCKISKYSRKELIGQDHGVVNSGYHPEAYMRNLWETIASKKTWKGELLNKAKDGTTYWVDTIITPFVDEQDQTYQYVATQFDITKLKKTEINLEQHNKELVKTNAELDRFVYSVSHDLRSPLRAILGLISFIEEESMETNTLEHVKMIRNSINRLDEYIKNILNYSRNNRTILEVKKVPLQQTVAAIVDLLHSMKEAKGIHFEIDIKELQPFYSDRLRLNTIMENIISNAIKYHKKAESGNYIKISGQSDHEKLQLSIADNGIGIAPAYHNKIFDMFFRLSGEKDGSGIGLYIVKDTVEILQGSIQVQSEKGIGTTFIVSLKNLKP